MKGPLRKSSFKVAEVNVDRNIGNPSWNSGYMRKCMHVWLTVARKWCGVNVSVRRGEWYSDELKDTIAQIAECVDTRHMPMMEAALQTRSLEMMKIKQRHGDNLNACAKAVMYKWAKRQAKVPSHRELMNVLKGVGLVSQAFFIQAVTIQLSTNPSDDPMLPVQVNGNNVDILVDSGATISIVKASEHVCTPMSNFVTIVEVSGILSAEQLSHKTEINVEGTNMNHSFLISDKSPINLKGRDLLCKLHATIQCTPVGLSLTLPDDRVAQAFQFLQSTIVFIIGLCQIFTRLLSSLFITLRKKPKCH